MSIITTQCNEVGCQKCDATIIVRHWQHAREHGWCVPCDGHLQLCPDCLEAHKRSMFEASEAVPVGDQLRVVQCVNEPRTTYTIMRGPISLATVSCPDADEAKRFADLFASAPDIQRQLNDWKNAVEEIRDSVLHERGPLAEGGMTSEQVNSVLDIIDDAMPNDEQVVTT